MNIYADNGDKVVCHTYEAGYDSDKERAKEYLEVGKIYTIDYTEVDSWSTTVYLQEFPLIPFNSVFFEDYKPSQPAAITIAEYLKDPSTCIYCGSEEITGGEFEPETFHVYRDIQCRTCNMVWTEEFELTNVTLEDEPSSIN